MDNKTIASHSTMVAFDEWRIVPNDETLLFNFRDLTPSPDHAIAAIVEWYGHDCIMAIRQLRSESVVAKHWVVIEVCFKTSTTRALALKSGVPFNNETIDPLTTCSKNMICTAMSLKGMCLLSTADKIRSNIHLWARDIINNFLTKYEDSVLVAERIKEVWMEVDAAGIYRGDGTVIIQGYDQAFVDESDGSEWLFPNAEGYPSVRAVVRKCYMHCSHCHSTDGHYTRDCSSISLKEQAWSPTPTEAGGLFVCVPRINRRVEKLTQEAIITRPSRRQV